MPTAEDFERCAHALQELADRYHSFQKDHASFLNAIHQKDEAELRRYLDDNESLVTKKVDGELQISPVVFLRRVVVTRILEGQRVTLDDLAELERRIDDRDLAYFADLAPNLLEAIAQQKERKRSAFGSWNAFTELFYIDYAARSTDVKDRLKTMARFLKEVLALDDADLHVAGFDHNNGFGTDRCWLAFYPQSAGNHKDAIQIFLGVYADRFEYGLLAGSRVEDREVHRALTRRPSPDVDEIVATFRALKPRYIEANRKRHVAPTSPGTTISARVPLNLILHGPPGTGKTYSVQRRAVQIIEGTTADLSPTDVREKYWQYAAERRIEFVTFHPSYSYEEFVEGFRYDPDLQIPVLKDGLLKRIVERALNPQDAAGSPEEAQIWKVSLGGAGDPDVFDRCMDQGEIAIGWFDDTDLTGKSEEEIQGLFEADGRGGETNNIRSVNQFVNEIKRGDYVAILKDQKTIRAIGVVDNVYAYREDYGKYRHTRPVTWLDRRDHDIYEMNGNRIITMPTIYRLNRIAFQDFIGLLPARTGTPKPYVLIIDEINRGNISRIFGELITLLEPDKRRGAPNGLAVRLPYSQQSFAVPDNLFVIGTMNSADRSIALIDVALRRRFEFEEMMPSVDVVQQTLFSLLEAEDEDVELTPDLVDLICNVFVRLNQRITVLLDRDHQIGHSFFMHLTSMADLHRVLYRQVFPTLQEYFYNDRDRLVQLLGAYDPTRTQGFVETMRTQFRDAFRDASHAPDEAPWRLHPYAVGELEEALHRTFGTGDRHGA
ncbi:MAG: AAA family ATPase [Bacteroidota bacterium]